MYVFVLCICYTDHYMVSLTRFFILLELVDCEEQPACEALLLKVEEEQAAALAAANAKFGDEALDTENMVPKKGNWDLKRVLAPKLELLEKRTQRAILEIARARLATGGDTGEGLARAVAEARIESSDEEDIP